MSQCFTSPNHWGYNLQQIFVLVMFKIPKLGHLPTPDYCGSFSQVATDICPHHRLDALLGGTAEPIQRRTSASNSKDGPANHDFVGFHAG